MSNPVSNSNKATTTSTWEQAERLVIRGLTRPCYNFCVKDLPKRCQKEFNPQGYKNPDQKCKEAWMKCMKLCIRQDLPE
jgi:hypothetical protein